MIESIERVGTKVVIKIRTGIQVKESVLSFDWECEYEYVAELLKYQLLEQEAKDKQDIAKQPHLYLVPKELSELKSKLDHEWNGSKHCWK